MLAELADALSLTSQGSRASSSDIILRFTYSNRTNTDMRTFTVHRVILDGSSDDIELYRFYHPITGLTTGDTTFYRRNMNTNVFEPAGQIQWMSDSNVTVGFGIDEVMVLKRSRRFKAGGSEYKWRVSSENSADIYCIDSRGRTVTTWSQEELLLRVAPRVEAILDRIVVTCLLNMWYKDIGQW
ncbi:hypothetical protein BD779DRAFT_1465568 [Infundibulicybe gibba]|nr:hypothetical protein BD779DRAFT_1465568 [Infundibulicybe gibba]